MAQQGGGCRKLLVIGCLVALGLLVLVLIAAAVLFGMAWSQVREEQVEQRELRHELTPAAAAIGDAPLEVPGEFELPGPAGRVGLDLRHAFFSVGPGSQGEPLAVDARFDTSSYRLTERLSDGEEGWVYEVSFVRTTDSYLLGILKELIGGTRPRVRISLPPDVHYDLEIDILEGGAEVELGGLWLGDAELSFLRGGGEVSFSDPLRQPMEQLGIAFFQGGGEITGIANAAPRSLTAEFSMGGGDIDLRGRWTRDAHITIDQSMGGVSIRLPDGVVIRGLGRHDTEPSETAEDSEPTLRFTTSSSMGELDIFDPQDR